jgi:hypothetical protein
MRSRTGRAVNTFAWVADCSRSMSQKRRQRGVSHEPTGPWSRERISFLSLFSVLMCVADAALSCCVGLAVNAREGSALKVVVDATDEFELKRQQWKPPMGRSAVRVAWKIRRSEWGLTLAFILYWRMLLQSKRGRLCR